MRASLAKLGITVLASQMLLELTVLCFALRVTRVQRLHLLLFSVARGIFRAMRGSMNVIYVLLCIRVLRLVLYTPVYVPWAFSALKMFLRQWHVLWELLAGIRDCRKKFNAPYVLQASFAPQLPLRNPLGSVERDFFVSLVLQMLPLQWISSHPSESVRLDPVPRAFTARQGQ